MEKPCGIVFQMDCSLVVGLVSGLGVDEVMERANQLGAFVATRSGGHPIYDSRMLLELSEAWAKS